MTLHPAPPQDCGLPRPAPPALRSQALMARPPSRTSRWPTNQSHDGCEDCMEQMASRAAQALERSGLQPASITPVIQWPAARSQRAPSQQVMAGPLKEAIVEGLQGPQGVAFDASAWLHVVYFRMQLLARRDRLHERLLATAYQPHPAVPQDNTSAILALDALESASPCAAATAAYMGVPPCPRQQTRDRHRTGYQALILASTFSPAMQQTFVARVLVATALSYMNLRPQAERLMGEGALKQLELELAPNARSTPWAFYGPLRGNSSQPGVFALRWLQSAALAAESTALDAYMAQGLALVKALPKRAPRRMRPSGRWPYLELMGPLCGKAHLA